MWNVKLIVDVCCMNVYVNGYRECKILYVIERMGFGLLYSSFVRVWNVFEVLVKLFLIFLLIDWKEYVYKCCMFCIFLLLRGC